MVKYKPKNFKCDDCGREQYTKDKCYGCNGNSFSPLVEEGKSKMKVRTLFIHPTKGMQDATINNASSVKEVVDKLEEIGCKVLTAEEE